MRGNILFGVLFVALNYSGFAQWSRVAYPGTWISAFLVKGDTALAGSNDQIFRSTNQGESWQTLAQLSTLSVSAFLSHGDALFVSTQRTRACPPGICDSLPSIFRSTDQGQTWNTVLNAVYGANALQRTSTTLYSNPDGSLSRSINSGATWQPVALDTAIGSTTDFVFTHSDSLYLYTREHGLHKSTDGGTTWRALTGGIPDGAIYSMAVRGTDLYAAAAGYGIYRSTDYGNSWHPLIDGFGEAGGAHTLLTHNDALFAASGDSVYLLRDADLVWRNVSEGLNPDGFRFVASLAVSKSYIFAGTNDGVWRRPLSEIITSLYEETQPSVPLLFSLYQNYPNPFNPTTSISYELPASSWVTLRIFNMLGQEVVTLVNGEKEAGRHQVQWDAAGLPSGVYLYQLQAGNYFETRKLVLVQ